MCMLEGALSVSLTPEEKKYLDEPYKSQPIVSLCIQGLSNQAEVVCLQSGHT